MILYIDARWGISGDRALAAMKDLGLPGRGLREAFQPLAKFRNRAVPRKANEILRWVESFSMDRPIRRRTLQALKTLIRAEAKAHGVPSAQVHFHQLARPDTLESFIGFAAGLVHFRIKRVHVSPIRVGNFHRDPHGFVRHRPGPATVELLKTFPVRWMKDEVEWTTPTGAALVSAFAVPGPFRFFEVRRIGTAASRARNGRGAAMGFLLGEPLRNIHA